MKSTLDFKGCRPSDGVSSASLPFTKHSCGPGSAKDSAAFRPARPAARDQSLRPPARSQPHSSPSSLGPLSSPLGAPAALLMAGAPHHPPPGPQKSVHPRGHHLLPCGPVAGAVCPSGWSSRAVATLRVSEVVWVAASTDCFLLFCFILLRFITYPPVHPSLHPSGHFPFCCISK